MMKTSVKHNSNNIIFCSVLDTELFYSVILLCICVFYTDTDFYVMMLFIFAAGTLAGLSGARGIEGNGSLA